MRLAAGLRAALVQDHHGTGMIPQGYRNGQEPTWAEAGKWLARQAQLFNKGKLTPLRAIIIREVLGEPSTSKDTDPLHGNHISRPRSAGQTDLVTAQRANQHGEPACLGDAAGQLWVQTV